MKISIIVGLDNNNVIGNKGKLPWHLPNDLKHFKSLTLHHPIIMGRKTYESIGKPLVDRTNIILTKDYKFNPPDCILTPTIASALLIAEEISDEVFIIGGAEIYARFMALADTLYVTKVDASVEGDTYFPKIDLEQWYLLSWERINDDKGTHAYSFLTYSKINNPVNYKK